MDNFVEIFFMTLQGLSTSIIDLFFLMTLMVTFMTIYRFGQFGARGKMSMKKARDLTIEHTVQGIVIGALLSIAVIFLGLPLIYSDYLFFLLPLSFVLGLYHIRFTNLTYAATMLAIFGAVLNGQSYGDAVVPDIGIDPSGLGMIAGLLMLLVGILLYLTGSRSLVPIVVEEEDQRILGFAMQRFWPVPVALLAAVTVVASGSSVPMPLWWPLLNLPTADGVPVSMFLLPLLLIVSHGSIGFGQSPKEQVRYHYLQQIISGAIMMAVGYLASSLGGLEWLVVIVMIGLTTMPEVYWYYRELGRDTRYLLDQGGVYIIGVAPRSFAEKDGFEIGDLIQQVDGVEVESIGRFEVMSRGLKGDQSIRIRRGQEERDISLAKPIVASASYGLSLLPTKDLQVYKMDEMNHMNMMHLMQFGQKKKDDAD